jgi:hypothetical protein
VSRALLILLFLASCREKSDQDLIGELVDRTISAANERKAGGVVEGATESFKGPQGTDLHECRRVLTGYFLQNGWVRVFEQSREIEVDGNSAKLKLDVVIAVGNAIEKLEDLVPTNGTHLIFDVALSKIDGEWKYVSASWTRAP